jgi:hypothetical protein
MLFKKIYNEIIFFKFIFNINISKKYKNTWNNNLKLKNNFFISFKNNFKTPK